MNTYERFYIQQVLEAKEWIILWCTSTVKRIMACLPGGDRTIEINYETGEIRYIYD